MPTNPWKGRDNIGRMREGSGSVFRSDPLPSDFWQHDRFASYSRRCFRRVAGMATTLQALLSSAQPYSRIGASVPAPHCSRLSRRSARAFRVLAATDRNYVQGLRPSCFRSRGKTFFFFFFLERWSKTRGIIDENLLENHNDRPIKGISSLRG